MPQQGVLRKSVRLLANAMPHFSDVWHGVQKPTTALRSLIDGWMGEVEQEKPEKLFPGSDVL